MAIAWLLSADKKLINSRVIIWGTLLQLVFAFFIFIVPAGSAFLDNFKEFIYNGHVNDTLIWHG